MKKALLLLALVCLVACNNNSNQNQSNESNSTELFTETVETNEVSTPKKQPVTLDFPSYHLYADDSEKYDASGYIPSKAVITIDEDGGKAVLKLYDGSTGKWDTFSFRIEKKVKRAEDYVTFLVYNNANKKSYIDVKVNDTEGIYIDVKYFVYDGAQIACWMKDNNESDYGSYTESTTIESTPNTYSSPSVGSGSIHSEERITGSYSNYSNYEETDNCVEGVVVYEGDDDYYIVETRRGYTVLERRSGSLWEGHKVRGELNRYGTKYLINRNRDSEVRVYIEDYALSEDDALEWMGENDHLKDDDQEAYDAINQ